MLTILQHALNDDFSRVGHFANCDAKMSEITGIKPVVYGGKEFNLLTILCNLKWLDGATLEPINLVVVKHAYPGIELPSSDKLKGRADSFIVGTDVEYPIDL